MEEPAANNNQLHQNDGKKRLDERNRLLKICQSKLEDLQQEILWLKQETDRCESSTEEEKKKMEDDEKKLNEYLSSCGISIEMIDEPSLVYIKQQLGISPDPICNNVPSEGANELLEHKRVQAQCDVEAFREARESLQRLKDIESKMVSPPDNVDLAKPQRDEMTGEVIDPYLTISSLQSVILECKTLQKKLWELCERQQAAVESAERRLSKLEKDLESHQTIQRSGSVEGDSSPNNVGQMNWISKKIQGIKNRLQRVKIFRVLQVAYEDVKRQNIRIQIEISSILKLFFFVMVFGARAYHGDSASSKKGLSFYQKYRSHLLCIMFFLAFMLQSGMLQFLYSFFNRDWMKLWREISESGHEMNYDNQALTNNAATPQRRRSQRAHNQNNNNVQHISPQPQPAPIQGVANGAIQPRDENQGGFLMDIGYLLASFVLSLFPTWRPVGANPAVNIPQEPPLRNNADEEQQEQNL